MSATEKPILDLRRQIDEIDAALQDLIIRRTSVVEEIAHLKDNGAAPANHLPAREAQVVRRLVQRHHGPFPKAALVRMWREMISALVRLQGPFAVAVYAPEEHPGYWDLARDHYGSQTPITAHGSTAQVVRAVTEGIAAVGVLPIPDQDDSDSWWRGLVGSEPKLPRVIGRLPFGAAGTLRGDPSDALVIGVIPYEGSGHDRSLLVLETQREISRSALKATLSGLGFDPALLQVWRDQAGSGLWLYLLEIAGYSLADDPRLARLAEEHRGEITRVWRIGGYAVPLAADELGLAQRG